MSARIDRPGIQLLGSRDCPNVEPTRQRLREILASEGLPPVFEEVDLDAQTTPPELRSWGSPTVLVDGEDIAGGPAGTGPGCRLYRQGESLTGIPPDDLIRVAIRNAGETDAPARVDLLTRRLGLWLWGLPAAAVVLGTFLGRTGHVALWVPAFTVAGLACVMNARGCGRIHCHVTGPAFLVAAGSTVLVALGLLPIQFGTVLAATATVAVLSFVPELVHRRRYVKAHQPCAFEAPGPRR